MRWKSTINSNSKGQIINLNSLFPIGGYKSPVHNSETVVQKDLLAISCHLWGNFKDDWQKRYLTLTEAAKTLKLTEMDYYNAELVADYFSKQILIRQLKGELSSFQQAVLTFITSNRMSFDANNPGLIYRLPEYYETDQRLLKMKDEYYINQYVPVSTGISIREMTPLLKVNRNTAQFKADQYWFTDTETLNLVKVEIDSKNKIKYMWDHLFETSHTVKIKGEWENQTHSLNFNYMTSNDWTIEFEKITA